MDESGELISLEYSNETNSTRANLDSHRPFESLIAILVGVTFSITIVVGIIGNSLVLLTVLFQKQMRSTTNIIILNLSIAELLFILLCVPFTGLNYVLSIWYFGDLCCRIYQYTSYVTCYVIILLLVLMSLDRYLAICKMGSSSFRNQKNATLVVTILWIFILVVNLPHLLLWTEHSYSLENENRTVCILKYNIIATEKFRTMEEVDSAMKKTQAYYMIFFLCGYLLPFIAIVIIYGLIMLKLKNAKGKQVGKSKRRVTFMVIAVVSSFVLCWGPLQIMLFLQHVVKVDFDEKLVIVLVTSNCIAYLNTCINPIIYGFANQDFRRAYAAILRCEYSTERKYAAVGTQFNRADVTQINNTKQLK